ncbi:ribulose bisphosphate carboxylase small subunit [Leptolyngbya sp. CCY15150]|uniref:ribulose bisphosphate carboxylase small subunit n=1 Tax=Leptolyngbya sp. CCY15150 TaxID=2767772 RepID=UPI00194FBAA2|nr:ribulose bisphosphate carboxylase small subunit [Leptolyngbya sp. CCY15150]
MTYYISPRFLNTLAVHITKNFLDLPNVRVPLILGIHGRKGEGKSFQCELVFQKMKINVVHISGAELESPDAGDPARLVRLRYREAAELVRVQGKMTVLMINDLDAGAGRFDGGTQYTVNTQLVNGTLMNIADNPTNVQLPGSYDERPIQRIPILVTGNDLSTLYAPLIRDGRMVKFYWEPDRSDRLGIVSGIFEGDRLSTAEIEKLVDLYPKQSIDFFSALRSRIYDEQIQRFIHDIGLERVSQRVVNSKEGPPTFPKPDFNFEHLQGHAQALIMEQDRVRQMRLVREYNQGLGRSQLADEPDVSPLPSTPAPPSVPPSASTSTPSTPSTAAEQPDHAGLNGASARLDPEVCEQVQRLVNQGCCIGLEHVDARRFRMNSWQSGPSITAGSGREAIAQLEQSLAQYPKEYVRIIGIDPASKTRVMEVMVQRPS